MFWGLSMEPGKRYTQQVEDSFHISQAAIDVTTGFSGEDNFDQVILEHEGNDFILATLSKYAKIYQVPLDLNFRQGDQVSFRTVGRAHIHLCGYHVPEDDELESRLMDGVTSDEEELDDVYDSPSPVQSKRKKDTPSKTNNKKPKLDESNSEEDDEEEDEEGDFSALGESTLEDLMGGLEEDDDDDEDGEEDDNDDDDEDEDESDSDNEVPQKQTPKLNGTGSPKQKNKPNKSVNESEATPKKEAKQEKAKTPKQDIKTPKQEGKTPKQEKKVQQTPKSAKKEGKTPKKGENGSPASSSQKKVLEGGVIAEEVKAGDGPVAKPGKMVTVYYVGRLKSNNKQFDATSGGPGFKFRLGRGEVIKGWDIGVSGMRVGAKRRLTIPAGLAYGAKGAPPTIPPNATLVFDVELRGIS